MLVRGNLSLPRSVGHSFVNLIILMELFFNSIYLHTKSDNYWRISIYLVGSDERKRDHTTIYTHEMVTTKPNQFDSIPFCNCNSNFRPQKKKKRLCNASNSNPYTPNFMRNFSIDIAGLQFCQSKLYFVV